jgi:SagB-type dehydrogenase family enzyme
MDFPEQEIGLLFQEETKYIRPSSLVKPLARRAKTVGSRIIELPSPRPLEGWPGFWKVLQKRRSVRDYTPAPLTLTELSSLLWATQGITRKASASWYRTAPSAGALHPIDTYLVINRVEGLDPGIYFFGVAEFALEMKRTGNFSSPVARAALEQEMVRAAAIVFVWVAVVRRSSQKYRQRAYRYIYLDCGHIGQNLYLAAAAMNLGCCGIAAFFDDEINDLVGVDGREETAIYLATVGKK